MAQRRIGQEVFRFGAKPERQTILDALAALIDCAGGAIPSPRRASHEADRTQRIVFGRAPSGAQRREGLAASFDVQGAAACDLVRSFRCDARRGALGPGGENSVSGILGGELPPLWRLCPRGSNSRAHRLCALSPPARCEGARLQPVCRRRARSCVEGRHCPQRHADRCGGDRLGEQER